MLRRNKNDKKKTKNVFGLKEAAMEKSNLTLATNGLFFVNGSEY